MLGPGVLVWLIISLWRNFIETFGALGLQASRLGAAYWAGLGILLFRSFAWRPLLETEFWKIFQSMFRGESSQYNAQWESWCWRFPYVSLECVNWTRWTICWYLFDSSSDAELWGRLPSKSIIDKVNWSRILTAIRHMMSSCNWEFGSFLPSESRYIAPISSER